MPPYYPIFFIFFAPAVALPGGASDFALLGGAHDWASGYCSAAINRSTEQSRLIDSVYPPLIGDNLAKQVGVAGERSGCIARSFANRSDRGNRKMPPLSLLSPVPSIPGDGFSECVLARRAQRAGRHDEEADPRARRDPKVNREYIRSAAQSDQYRTEPPFQLQGSYRNMNRIAEKVVPIMNDQELQTLILSNYENDAQTLTSNTESDLLKFKELMGILSEEESRRWASIKHTFQQS